MNIFVSRSKYNFHVLGPCYCEDKNGNPGNNEIICIKNEDFERHDICHGDEGCIGPKRRNDAKLFLRSNFCSKGELNVM